MGGYEEYLGRLKGLKAELDGGEMYARIEARAAGETRRKRLILEGVLALLLIGAAAYLNVRPYLIPQGETLADYVYQQEAANGDPVVNYVFSN